MEDGSTWWLRSGDAFARRITPAGLLIGRSPRCDVVVPSERVSRRQAMVHLSAKGPILEVLGRAMTRVRGERVARSSRLDCGDRIELPDTALEVRRESPASPRIPRGSPVWVLEGPSGALFGMVDSPFSVGGGGDDDVKVEGWQRGALSFRSLLDGRLELTPSVDVSVDGNALAAGVPSVVKRGAAVALSGARVRVVTGGAFASGSTLGEPTVPDTPVQTVRLEFLPRGGRLRVGWECGETRAIYLADRRCDLIAALLQPPAPHAPGDFIEDKILLGRIWHAGSAGRTNLNVLLHRVRKDLARAGLDEGSLQRSEGGGATRFVLHPQTRVEVE